MERPATWKVVTLGAALTGLGIVGAGTATAASAPVTQPASISAGAAFDAPLFPRIDFDVPGIDDSFDGPGNQFVAMDDTWDETYWDTSWDD